MGAGYSFRNRWAFGPESEQERGYNLSREPKMVHDKSSRETPLNGRGRHDPDQDIGVEFELMTQEDQTSLETIITEEGALAGTEDSHSEQTHGRSLADAPASSAKGKQSSDLAAGPESPSKANERRAYIRYKLTAPVELTDSRTGQTSQAVVTDVGRGGCFVKTNSPAAIGTTLKLSITQSDQCFRARARAVSIQPGQGMGILFTEVEAEDLEVLERWLAASMETIWVRTSRRKSQRVVLKVSILVQGKDTRGKEFSENTESISVSAHGCLLLLSATVAKGQPLIIRNLRTNFSQECSVVYMGREQDIRREVGVSFMMPNSNFWQVNFPPWDWSPQHPDAKGPGANSRK